MRNAHTVLDQFLEPIERCLTADVARQLVDFRIDPQTQARVNELAHKANAGELTNEERLEYQGYIDASDMIAILQAKARSKLSSSVS